MTDEAKNQDAADADSILQTGWRQGSVLDPRQIDIQLPPGFVLHDGDLLILCTQSCSVVSPRFATDPIIELMVAKPLNKFNERAFEATGKNQRKLHVQLPPDSEAIALECDLSRRFFCDRRLLLRFELLGKLSLDEKAAGKLAVWLGRSYTRIALPNQLVSRMRSGLLKLISASLETPYGGDLEPLYAEVPYIYLRWDPQVENAEVFSLSFQFICNEAGASEALDEVLIDALKPYEGGAIVAGIRLEQWECKVANATFLTDLDGYERFSDWDYLSDIVDAVDARA